MFVVPHFYLHAGLSIPHAENVTHIIAPPQCCLITLLYDLLAS